MDVDNEKKLADVYIGMMMVDVENVDYQTIFPIMRMTPRGLGSSFSHYYYFIILSNGDNAIL